MSDLQVSVAAVLGSQPLVVEVEVDMAAVSPLDTATSPPPLLSSDSWLDSSPAVATIRLLELVLQTIHRIHNWFSQSLLVGNGYLLLPALSHLRHY